MTAETFRFSPRANRAHEITWRGWHAHALEEAVRLDRPVLLNLTAVWCHWCHLMDETTYSDAAIIELINRDLIAVRVDADKYPHVQDRYIAGGWPTNAFLTPTGEVLWAGTYIEPAEFRAVADSVISAWRERRDELGMEIERRRRAVEAARGRPLALGLVRREAADDVSTAMRDSFDARNGGFGDAPKFPQPEAIELMYSYATEDAAWSRMADQTLDGMLAGELWDAVDGGFFRYALNADWTAPRHEKLLDTNATLLDGYALGAALRDRDDWRDVAARTVDWVERTLTLADGLWGGSQAADPEYFTAAAAARAARPAPHVDDTIYTSSNARWIAALAHAGARLQREAWITRAASAMTVLCARMQAANGGLYHYAEQDAAPRFDFLLVDTLAALRACLALAEATGGAAWLTQARAHARHIEQTFWAEDGGFWDRRRTDHDVGVLHYRDRPFEHNALAARLLLDLTHVTGERVWRALAERTLARLGPQAGRYGAAGAPFALATDEFFEPAPAVVIAVPDTQHDPAAVVALRNAAFRLPIARLRVWTVPAGHTVGPHRFAAADQPVAYLWTTRGCSAPFTAPEALVLAGAAAR